jgi:hypothetical protein
LETRLAPATVDWGVNADGDYDNPANWNVRGTNPVEHRVPGPGDTAVLNVAADVTITVRDARVVESLTSSERVRIVNGGSLEVTAGTANSISRLLLESGGTVSVSGIGTVLTPGDASTYAGALNVGAGAVFALGGGPGSVGHSVNPGVSFGGPGEYKIAPLTQLIFNTSATLPGGMVVESSTFEATLRVNAGATVTAGPTFAMRGTGAKLALAGTFVVPGGSTFNWEGGRIEESGSTAGSLNILQGGTFNIRGTGTRTLSDVAVNNAGTVNWPDAIPVQGENTRVNNQPTGFFNISNDANLGEETWIFTNQGSVNKSSPNPNSQTFILAQFDNTTGTVNVNSGQLRFFRGTNTSAVNTAVGTRVLYNGHSSLLADDYVYGTGASFNGPGDLVVAGEGVLTVNTNLSVQRLQLTTVLQGSGNVTVTGTLTWNTPGQMKGTGATILAATGTANLVGTSNSWRLERTFTNHGVVNWTGTGALDLVAPFQNQAGALFHAASDADTSPFGAGAFHNAGTFRKSSPVGTGRTMLQANAFHNTGLVEVVSGILALDEGGTSSGEFHTEAGATLAFTSGTHTLNAGTQFTGPGTSVIDGATVVVNADLTTARLALDDGALDGARNLTITGTFDWTGGALRSSTGRLTIAAGATLNLSGNRDKDNQDRTIDLAGTAVWAGTGNFNSGGNAVLNILAGGEFRIQNDEAIGSGTWNNDGTIRKTNSLGTTTVSVFNTFTNRGTIHVQSGTFDVAGVYNQISGSTLVDAGAALISSFNGDINIQGGTLGGNGSVGNPTEPADVTSSGVVSPGASVGTLTIHGTYTQTVSGRLRIEVGGTGDTQYDRLVVTGDVTLGGILELTLVNGFTPVANNTFQPLTYGARLNNSRFAGVAGATISSSLVFQANPGAADVALVTVRNDLAQHYVWIGNLYQDLLLRPGSPSEILGWVNLAALGVSRERIVQGFLGSLEYRIRVVQNLYQTLLQRPADAGGLNNWTNFLVTGTPAQMRVALAGSAEYFARRAGNNNANFVRALFLDALQRPASTNDVNNWVSQILRGRSRASVATALFTSTEHRQKLVRSLYLRFLRRAADPGGLTSNVNRLAVPGGRDEHVILNLVSSTEYFNRP